MVIMHATCNMLRGCPEVVMAGRRRLPLSRDGRGVSSWRWFIGRRKSRRRWVVTEPQSDREDQPGGFHRAGVLRFPFTAGLLAWALMMPVSNFAEQPICLTSVGELDAQGPDLSGALRALRSPSAACMPNPSRIQWIYG